MLTLYTVLINKFTEVNFNLSLHFNFNFIFYISYTIVLKVIPVKPIIELHTVFGQTCRWKPLKWSTGIKRASPEKYSTTTSERFLEGDSVMQCCGMWLSTSRLHQTPLSELTGLAVSYFRTLFNVLG